MCGEKEIPQKLTLLQVKAVTVVTTSVTLTIIFL